MSCGDRAVGEGGGALVRDGAQRRGEGGVAQDVAGRQRQAGFCEEVGGGAGVAAEQEHVAGDVAGEALADREAFFREADRRGDQARPGQAAMGAVRGLQHGDGAGDADGAAARHGLQEGDGAAVAEEEVGAGGGGGGLAPVPGGDAPGAGVEVQQQRAAADARGLRLDQREHHLNRDGGVEGGAAVAQHREAGLGGERMAGGDHVAARGFDLRDARMQRQHEAQQQEQDGAAQVHCARIAE
jgi:hypothetical protein